ncbi:hypothetical protein GCM10007852_01890 [Agaribacter marinus]|uniref:Uncharacterized protein n=2 Tax=Agaribacter marinus TaxID=1431249 RepID=A0AA37SX90_9ALTE|nr:hypothetical protein GCM10007852_01890 [Agaribacter marinus]
MHTHNEISTEGNTGEPTPARITELSTNDKKMLQDAARTLLFGRKITLSNTVFSKQNTVFVERRSKQNEQGKIIDGRQREIAAIVLSLWLENGECYLQRNDTKDKVKLNNAGCQSL